MKTLLNINKDILTEYNDWKSNDKDKAYDIGSYLSQYYEMNAAIAFSKLYFPDFVEKDGCIILGFRYSEQIFYQWFKKFEGDIKKTEYMCNFYDVQDYFLNNEVEYESEEIYFKAVDEFAKALKTAWEINLKILFPNRKMIVDVWVENAVTRITLFTDDGFDEDGNPWLWDRSKP